MKVLVTGGTGYLGRAVVSALAAHGHQLVAACGQRAHDGAAEIPGATGDQHSHGVWPRQYSSRSSSVRSIGISAVHPSSSRRRDGSPSSSGVSFGR